MADKEDTVVNESEVRRTRSGRAVRTPAAPPTKTTGRKKKKMVLVEVEVSDEEEVADHVEPKTDDSQLQVAELENSDNANEAVEMNRFVRSDNNEIDNCSNTAQFPEESIGGNSELNSFKGAIVSSECAENNLENNLAAENVEENNSVDNLVENTIGATTVEPDVLLEDVSLQQNESNISEAREDSKMDIDDGTMHKTEKPPSVTENETVEEGSMDKMETNTGDQVPAQSMDIGDPDTEVISEDELPGVPVAKVPETEEVSDEELPGPKRAELPADTEVVSEDELPTIKNKRKLAEGDYDPGSPTSENETPVKKPALDADVEKEKDDKSSKPKKLPTLDKYWKAVNDDPADFTGWTYLLQYVDQENDMEAAREAYDAFLSHYPYCYGYWRKYADYEKRKGNKKKCEEVFERGLKAIPLSVDLWIHYLTYVRTSRPDDEEFIRSQFERALSACGLEFRSDRLWDSYIKWETEAKRLQHVTAIYDRLLATPTQGYTTHFDNFQEHIASHAPNKVLEVDEFLALRKEMKHMLKHDAATEGDSENPDVPPGEDESKNVQSTDEETKVIRERIVSIRRKIHKNTVNAVTARWNFEEGIKRPYFHVKPLERCQLKNWQDYLDFEVEQGDQVRIVVLFERCLIACALYEEFWLRFVLYLEGLKDPNLQPKIKDVYERACTIHHLKKPNLHLQWAMFEESVQNFNRAAEILVNLEKSVPNLLQVAYRRINLERRRADYEKCCQLYEHYMSTTKNKVIASNLAIKFARFHWKVLKDLDKAMEVLNTAVTKDLNNARLYLQLIDFTLQKEEFTETDILSLIDAFLEKEGIDIEQKVLFAQRKLEFLEDFGSNIQAVQKAQEEYQKYTKLTKDMKKKETSKADTTLSKKDKNPPLPSSQSNSYGNYGNYSNSTNSGAYNQYSSAQQGQYNYAQYGQGDQYQYQNWQYPQSSYGSYNQWSGYSSGYGY
uniref:Pre-mRNA-processing factor 39 n=1 Tax=Photinus pyralis TaxID=7054 RepID=A0A1Y1LQW5_PHOPY